MGIGPPSLTKVLWFNASGEADVPVQSIDNSRYRCAKLVSRTQMYFHGSRSFHEFNGADISYVGPYS